MTSQVELILQRTQKMLGERAQRGSQAHADFMQMQELGLEQITALIEEQMRVVDSGQVALEVPPLFEWAQLVEFATGSMAKCFGEEFRVFEGRRHPRIPNGDLLLMSRVVTIDGIRNKLDKPSSILSEYDVPEHAWFWTTADEQMPPYSVLMEIALQPCGYLTAYLGTSLLFPQVDYFFRNLDGNGRVTRLANVRGQTITIAAKLLSTVANDSTIIQKFTFSLSCLGEVFFEGESVFGFFPPEGMANQAGLDGAKTVLPEYESVGNGSLKGVWVDLPKGQMNFLDRVFIGEGDQPYLFGLRKNDVHAWFYACHFYQDAVMPGSLGVEAILEALRTYAQRAGLDQPFARPVYEPAVETRMNWRYRGQILPKHEWMKIEVRVTQVRQEAGQVIVEGNASLWADGIRIYEIKQAAIRIREG